MLVSFVQQRSEAGGEVLLTLRAANVVAISPLMDEEGQNVGTLIWAEGTGPGPFRVLDDAGEVRRKVEWGETLEAN